MTREMRNNLTPQNYIRQLFRETKDGKLSITYAPLYWQTGNVHISGELDRS